MTANRFRVQKTLTPYLSHPQPVKLPLVHHLSRVAYQFIEHTLHFIAVACQEVELHGSQDADNDHDHYGADIATGTQD